MATSNHEFPTRLVHAEDVTAALLTRALAEPSSGPTEQESWRRLQAYDAPLAVRWLVPMLALGFAATGLLVWQHRRQPTMSVAAEVISRPTTAAPPVEPVTESVEQEKEVRPAPSERPRLQPSAHRDGSAAECTPLTKAGRYQAAAACYGRVAQGSSMDAELALYEKARLEAKALGQTAVALVTLDEHARRFPGGVLAAEVALTRIELLTQLGRRAEALAAIDSGLRGTLGGERGGDLQVLRADLLSAGDECEAALAAVKLARRAGVHASRLQGAEQRCPAATVAP